jgi:hypothetical protein
MNMGQPVGSDGNAASTSWHAGMRVAGVDLLQRVDKVHAAHSVDMRCKTVMIFNGPCTPACPQHTLAPASPPGRNVLSMQPLW